MTHAEKATSVIRERIVSRNDERSWNNMPDGDGFDLDDFDFHDGDKRGAPETALPPPAVRGVRNATGTACHVTCPLAVVCHCLAPLRRRLIRAIGPSSGSESFESPESAPSDSLDPFVRELAAFLRDWISDPGDGGGGGDRRTASSTTSNRTTPRGGSGAAGGAIDPSGVFRAVRESVGIEPDELGDAVTSLAKLLDQIRRRAPLSAAGDFVERQLHSGRCHFRIAGTARSPPPPPSAEGGGTWTRRVKETKPRPMASPFPVEGDFDTLEEGLRAATAPRPLEGYRWTGTYSEEEVVVPEGGDIAERVPSDAINGATTNTTKGLVVDEFPAYWMIHVKRFAASQNHNSIQADRCISIPSTLKPHDIMSTSEECQRKGTFPSSYVLIGGILHIRDAEPVGPDEEDGHYVAVFASSEARTDAKQGDREDDVDADGDDGDGSSCPSGWWLLDDEETRRISRADCLALLGGARCDGIVDTQGTQGTLARGVLLIYKSTR